MTPKKTLKKRKDKHYLIWCAICLTIALGLFVCVYGFKDGWDKVIAWFYSPYASILYVAIVLYLAVVITAIVALFGSKEVDKYVGRK